MTVERWGTLSVKDHLDVEALITDLLLYDRLVFPVFSGPGERGRWRGENWAPELQEEYIEDLGELAIRAEWDEARRKQYRDLRRARKHIAEDAFQSTRRVLTMNLDIRLPDGVKEVRSVAAYHDVADGRSDLGITAGMPDEQTLGQLGFVIAQTFLSPEIEPGQAKEQLKRARDTSLQPKYRSQRQAYYEWQESTVDAIVRGRKTVEGAVREMEGLVNELNQQIAGDWKTLTAKLVFTVVGVALPFALGIEKLALVATFPGAFELIKFAALEAREKPAHAKCEAAAMLVSASKALR